MKEYIFGANILENLTTGMYQDSKVIYREYIQNACDQIDKALQSGLLSHEEACIQIWLDNKQRIITIEDNATGIPHGEFKRILGNIADSDKKIGEEKGFRGIGRLCGLAYCKELIFTSTAKGETTVSTMRCNAQKMRELILENGHGEKHSAVAVLDAINEFSFDDSATVEEHWFKVELKEINDENKDLLDFFQIKDYLSFVAPVPYVNTFIFRSEIYQYAQTKNFKLDEYKIILEGEQIFKKYKTNFSTSKGNDEIFNLAFKDIFDSQGNLIAWIWWGISQFKAVIQKDCQMRGLRLRKENIQIGSDDALQKLFKEDRGHHYFIGEVFAVAKDLIPNSQRDYFNENPTRVLFEQELRRYFNECLKDIFYAGSAINSTFEKIEVAQKKEAEFNEKLSQGVFVDTAHKEAELEEMRKAISKAEEAKLALEKKKQKTGLETSAVINQIITRIENKRIPTSNTYVVDKKSISENDDTQSSWRTDKLSSYSKKERKLISKIFSVIISSVDKKTAELIIQRIEEELQ